MGKQNQKYVYKYFKGTINFDRFCMYTNTSENTDVVWIYVLRYTM